MEISQRLETLRPLLPSEVYVVLNSSLPTYILQMCVSMYMHVTCMPVGTCTCNMLQ